jgi:hypothetical protein
MPPFIVNIMVIRLICTDMFVADMVKETDSMVAVFFPLHFPLIRKERRTFAYLYKAH